MVPHFPLLESLGGLGGGELVEVGEVDVGAVGQGGQSHEHRGQEEDAHDGRVGLGARVVAEEREKDGARHPRPLPGKGLGRGEKADIELRVFYVEVLSHTVPWE